MILSPAAFDAVFGTGDETRAAARITGAQVAPPADVTTEKQSDAQWTAHPGQVDAPAPTMNRSRTAKNI